MKNKKVFCENCCHLVTVILLYTHDYECNYHKNVTRTTWLNQKCDSLIQENHPSKINARNNCKWHKENK